MTPNWIIIKHMTDFGYVIGADVGGGSARVAAVSRNGKILRKISIVTDPAAGYKPLAGRLGAAMDELIATRKGQPPFAMCVACAGAVDFKKNVIVSSPNFPGWKDVPLATGLRQGRKFPVILENDANAAAAGEGWIGAAKGWPSFAMFTLGTGVGGGIVLDGKVFRGDNGMAGELGHLPLGAPDRLCGCGRKGCLETSASASGVAVSARGILDSTTGGALRRACGGNPARVDAQLVARLASNGDKACLAIIQRAGHELGEAMGTLTLAIGITRFVIGGGMAGAFDLLKAPMRKAALGRAYTLNPRSLKIARSSLGGDAGLLGAAWLSWGGEIG